MNCTRVLAMSLLIGGLPPGGSTVSLNMAPDAIADSGIVRRSEIPNDYLEVSLSAGSISVVGTGERDIHWRTVASHQVSVRREAARSLLAVAAGNASRPDIVLRVPETLRLLHVKVHGKGEVKLSGLGSEVSVVIDSGSIIGQDLRGTLTLEAHYGDVRINLAGRDASRGHVVVLAQHGVIELTLDEHPSVSLDLATICGQVASEFELSKAVPKTRVMSPVAGIRGTVPAVDCRRGASWAPPLPGAPMQAAVQATLGAGSTMLKARAIQGDILVRSAGAMIAALPQQDNTLSVTRDLRVDGNAADLSRVDNILVARDGSIVVTQPQDGLFKYFSAAGQLVGTFGRKGAGPGEFQAITKVGWVGDSVWVYDRGLERMTVIAPERKLARNVRLPGAFGTDQARGFAFYCTPVGMMPDGRIVITGSSLEPSSSQRTPPKPGMARDVSLLNCSGEARAVPGTEPTPVPVAASGDIRAVAIIRKNAVANCGFENECPRDEPTLYPVDTRFVDAEPVTREVKNGAYLYRFTAHDATGKTLWVKTMPIAGLPLTKREADSSRAARLADLKSRQARMKPDEYAAAEFEIRRHAYPSIKVPVTLIYTGRDGSTWIRLRGTPRPWLVLDKDGNIYGRVTTPDSFRVLAVSLTALWGTEPNADGIDDIVRYAVKAKGRTTNHQE